MGYSKEMGGVFLAIGGLLLVQFGFSESCSGELTSKISPILGALPGLLMTYIARFNRGGVGLGGKRK